jgi:hypothetical protein
MTTAPPDSYIQLWFKELLKLQASCINNDARKLSPLNFANATIVTYLKSSADQNDFLVKAADAIQCTLQASDLTTCKTFRGLLDYCHPLETDVFNALQKLSIASLQKIPSVAYYATPVVLAFPGKSTDAPWSSGMGLLMASMDPTCLTLPFRIKINATVDKAGSSMSALIKQIAGLG